MSRQTGGCDNAAIAEPARSAQATGVVRLTESTSISTSHFGLMNSAGEIIARSKDPCSSSTTSKSSDKYRLNRLVTLTNEGWTALYHLLSLKRSSFASIEFCAYRADMSREPCRLLVSQTYRPDLWAFEIVGENDAPGMSAEKHGHFSSLSLGVAFFASDDGRLLWANAAAFQSMDCDPDRLNWIKIQEGADIALPPPLELDRPKSFFYSGNTKKVGAHCAAHVEPIVYCNSIQAVLLTVFRTPPPRVDARSQRAGQAQLFRTSQALSVSEMASILAHELNQPLGAVNNYLSGILRRLQDGRSISNNEIERPLEAARKQAAHASAIIQRMRDFVRSKEPKFTAVDVKELIDSVFSTLVSDEAVHDVSLQAFVPLETPRAHADAILIEQVLMNLVRNGIDATRESGRPNKSVAVRVSKAATGLLRICVEDNGIGFSAHLDQDSLSPLQTTKPDGLGLGLSICRSILEIHQGHLAIERSTSEGTSFFFTLRATD